MSIHVLIMADHYLFSYDFLCHRTTLLSRMFIFLQFLPKLIALKFLIRQILPPAETLPFLRNLVTSPVRHAELEQRTIGIAQLIGNDSNTQNGIFRYFNAPFSKTYITSCQECCSCCLCKACSSLGQKKGNERAITRRRIILTYPFIGISN